MYFKKFPVLDQKELRVFSKFRKSSNSKILIIKNIYIYKKEKQSTENAVIGDPKP